MSVVLAERDIQPPLIDQPEVKRGVDYISINKGRTEHLERLIDAYKFLSYALRKTDPPLASFRISLIVDTFIEGGINHTPIVNGVPANNIVYQEYQQDLKTYRRNFRDPEEIRMVKTGELTAAGKVITRRGLDNARKTAQRLIERNERFAYYLDHKILIDSYIPWFRQEIDKQSQSLKQEVDPVEKAKLKLKLTETQQRFRGLIPPAFRNPERFKKETARKLSKISQFLDEMHEHDPRRHLLKTTEEQLKWELERMDIKAEQMFIHQPTTLPTKNGTIHNDGTFTTNGKISYEAAEQARQPDLTVEYRRRLTGSDKPKQRSLLDRLSGQAARLDSVSSVTTYINGRIPPDMVKLFNNFGVPYRELAALDRAHALATLQNRIIEVARDYYPRLEESLDPEGFEEGNAMMIRANVLMDTLVAYINKHWRE